MSEPSKSFTLASIKLMYISFIQGYMPVVGMDDWIANPIKNTLYCNLSDSLDLDTYSKTIHPHSGNHYLS